jgi:hypothetical protein
VTIEHILYILHILHIWNTYADVCLSSGFDDCMAIFKAAAWYSLTDEEREEILSCSDILFLTAYVDSVFREAVRLWKFIMLREAKDFFQTEVFHPASLDPNLQKHLGMTTGQLIFDM